MKKFATAMALGLMTAGSAMAQTFRDTIVIEEDVSRVPEIDASTGLLALAAVAASLALVWEIKRRRKA